MLFFLAFKEDKLGQGTKSRIEVFEDFMGFSSTTQGATQLPQGKVNYCGVGTAGSFAQVTDEPGGVLTVTSDSDEGDSTCLFIGPFKPADGGVVFETRFKILDESYNHYYAGFQETLDMTTPVLAAVSDSDGTLTHGAVGCHAGFYTYAQSDTQDWFVIAGDGAVAASNSTANGSALVMAPADSEFEVFRVEIDPHGNADFWVGKETGLVHVKHIDDAVVASDIQYAVLMGQSDSDLQDSVFEVDYMYAQGNVDWTQ